MTLDVSALPSEMRIESAGVGRSGTLVIVGDGWSASGSLDALSAALRLPLEIVDDCLRVRVRAVAWPDAEAVRTAQAVLGCDEDMDARDACCEAWERAKEGCGE
jgi:hypothetical protein